MVDRSPRPTQADVFSMLEQRRALYASMHQRMEAADEWLHADEDPSPILRYISRGFPPDHAWEIYPYAWTVLNRGVNQVFTAEVPQVTYELPADYKETYQRAADDEKAVQQALQGILYHVGTKSTRNPFLDLLHQQLGLGQGCLSYPRDYERWGEPPSHGRATPEEQQAWEMWEARRADAIPWAVGSLHPTWVFFDPDHDPPLDFIIERPVDLAALARRYPKLGLDPSEGYTGSRSSTPTARFVEYVSRDWYGCWVSQLPVTEHPDADEDGIAPNGLGHGWYQLAWSGMGKTDHYGRWERRGVGMIQRGISEFKGLTFDDNWLSLIKRAYIPKWVATGPTAEQAADATADIDPLSPTWANLPNDVTLSTFPELKTPEAVVRDMKERQQRLEQLYGPGLLSGEYHNEPAIKQASRLEQAKAPYRTPKANAEQAVASMLADMLWDLKYEPDLKDGISLAWETGKGTSRRQHYASLKPEQIHPGGKITVDFSPMTPEEKAAKVEEAARKQELGWWSQERAAKEAAEIDDPDEEEAKKLAERWLNSEAAIALMDEAAGMRLRARLGLVPPAPPAAGAPGMAPPPVAGPDALPQMPGIPPGEQPLGSDLAAMQQMRSAFRPPVPMMNGTGS